MKTLHSLIFSLSIFFVTGIVAIAATTIGTSIDTDGNLTVTGTSTLSGIVIAEDGIQGLSGEDGPRMVFKNEDEEDALVLYGVGSAAPTLNLNDSTISMFSPDTSSDVSVRDNAAFVSSGSANMTIDGNSGSITLSGSGAESVTLSGTGFVTMAGAGVRSSAPFGIPTAEDLAICDATIAPSGYAALMVDTTGPDLCMCDGTDWVPVDGSGTCSEIDGDDF